MDREHHLKRLGFRAWHRGTREADYMIGGLFDRYAAEWSDEEIAWSRRVVTAFEANPNAGVVKIDGKMIDKPHLRAALKILALVESKS